MFSGGLAFCRYMIKCACMISCSKVLNYGFIILNSIIYTSSPGYCKYLYWSQTTMWRERTLLTAFTESLSTDKSKTEVFIESSVWSSVTFLQWDKQTKVAHPHLKLHWMITVFFFFHLNKYIFNIIFSTLMSFSSSLRFPFLNILWLGLNC